MEDKELAAEIVKKIGELNDLVRQGVERNFETIVQTNSPMNPEFRCQVAKVTKLNEFKPISQQLVGV